MFQQFHLEKWNPVSDIAVITTEENSKKYVIVVDQIQSFFSLSIILILNN